MEYFAEGSENSVITKERAPELLSKMLQSLGTLKNVLLLPPDFSRYHSGIGELTSLLYQLLSQKGTNVEIMPAVGTHVPMTEAEINLMFAGIPLTKFHQHNWRRDVATLGEVPGAFVNEASGGLLDYAIPCEVNRMLLLPRWDRIFSLGQLVPHEVIGIANHNKNVFIGTGGAETINKSHFLGAVCGMERIMGQANSPVRMVLNYMQENLAQTLPITYIMNVRSHNANHQLVTRGLYAGEGYDAYLQGASLCQQVNINLLDKPIQKAIVYLDPAEYKSTWIGNKAVYRLRMAMADGGDLLIVAPGVKHCGEDSTADSLIRRYGYRGRDFVLEQTRKNEELQSNLSAAAHLIHGSSDGRFKITWCAGGMTPEEVRSVGYDYMDPAHVLKNNDLTSWRDGWNQSSDGEEVFYVSNPALGLWSTRDRFGN